MGKLLSMDNVKKGLYVALGMLVYQLVVKPAIDKVLP